MPVTINPTSSPSTAPSTTSPSSTPKALSSGDFMNLMITQLQHQDPLSPTDSNQLLQQISEISTLQSNQSLQTSLAGLTLQQSIGAGGNLIGKLVNGLDANGQPVSGQVIGVKVQNQKVLLALDSNVDIPMENITAIAPASIADGSNSATGGATSNATSTTASPLSDALQMLNAVMT
jgi:flagellar basal-body rod modification protein FlgD